LCLLSIVQELLSTVEWELELLLSGEDSESEVMWDMTGHDGTNYGTPNSIANGINMCAPSITNSYGSVSIRSFTAPLIRSRGAQSLAAVR
jgi:hypothetical protein